MKDCQSPFESSDLEERKEEPALPVPPVQKCVCSNRFWVTGFLLEDVAASHMPIPVLPYFIPLPPQPATLFGLKVLVVTSLLRLLQHEVKWSCVILEDSGFSFLASDTSHSSDFHCPKYVSLSCSLCLCDFSLFLKKFYLRVVNLQCCVTFRCVESESLMHASVVCICQSQTPHLSLPPTLPLWYPQV